MMQFELFDELDALLIEAEEKLSIEREQREAAVREEASKPKQCDHCGEWSLNSYLDSSNHGIVFNGWCSKRLTLNSWAKPGTWAEEHEEQFETSTAWLAERGWIACDEHDRTNWAKGHIPYWEVSK